MIKINCPEPIVGKIDVVPFNKKMDSKIAVEAILEGEFVIITDFFSTGLKVLNSLKYFLEKKHSNSSFEQQRDYRSEFRMLSNKLLVLISNNQIKVKKSPKIGWFKIFYNELDEFLLPFPQIQGLNSAWQWYEKGISIPVLDQKIFPFFGTYFPTRFEHLTLFENWLSNYKGEKKSVIDVGVGSGILSFQLLKHGFKKVIGTDVNPNAIVGLGKDYKNASLAENLELYCGNLFAECTEQVELIVFNPPWIPETYNSSGIDKAIYYDEQLFNEFFTEAYKRLKPNGRIVLLFSNLAQVTGVTSKNPIEEELLIGNRFIKNNLIESSVKKASNDTRRKQSWRKNEKVQLWILKLK